MTAKKDLFTWFLAITSCLLPLTPVQAQTPAFGIVKSPENEQQWSSISARLQLVGINYCVVELSTLNNTKAIANLSVLFLPNIETLTPSQVISLQDWLNRGGKIIATGSTGSLSTPEVRAELRSLFGAYWGFPLTNPTQLEPLSVKKQEWVRQPGLSGSLQGGVVIPSGLNSQTAAVWRAEGTPPAIVVTNNSTFLGWRWGIDSVAQASLDANWLKATLVRHNQYTPVSNSGEVPCNSPQVTNNSPATNLTREKPPTITTNSEINPTNIDNSVPYILPANVEAKRQELENLIARLHSTLITANAYNHDQENSTTATIEKVENSGDKVLKSASTESNLEPPIIREAKAELANFLILFQQGNYQEAEEKWLQTRNLLWENYPRDQYLASSEIRAIWLDRGTLVQANSETKLAQLFEQFTKAGINTIFLETVNASYTIYPSKVAPEQNPLLQGWDPLATAIKLAHERGIELHAWVWIFAAANQRHNQILNQPSDYLGPVLSRHPDWVLMDKEGNFWQNQSQKAFFDPANPEVRNYLLSLLNEIATNYEIDGIQLDYIRYPFQDQQNYSYGNSSRLQFYQQTGIDPITLKPGDFFWHDWTQFRIQQIDTFVADVSQNLKQQHPELLLSTAVFPLPTQQRLNRIQQNWESWAKSGYVDLIFPMTYTSETEELQQMIEPLLQPKLLGSSLILPAVRLLNLADIQALDQIQLLRNLTTSGYALFAAENWQPNLQKLLENTQASQSNILPQRQPFEAAFERYQALQREWNFLITNNQLIMESTTLKDWAKQADTVATNLRNLAEEPSEKHLLLAQVSLTSFRENLSKSMLQYQELHPYQVQVWLNRLQALEWLLSYGQRVILIGDNPR